MSWKKRKNKVCINNQLQLFIGVSNIEKLRQDLLSTKSDIEIINFARLGTEDYDYNSINIIKEGGQAIVFEVKSKIDGKMYAAKRLQYQIGSKYNTSKIQAAAEREVGCIRGLNHPMIIGITDLVKDEDNFPCIIMERCN